MGVEFWWITRADRGALVMLWRVVAKPGSSHSSIRRQDKTRRMGDNRRLQVGVEMGIVYGE